MTDFAAARQHMVDGQVRTADVTDLRILTAMETIPRECFVPDDVAALAYLDHDLPAGSSRRLIKPMVLAKLIQALDLSPTDHVLDVACAIGYGAAVLSQLAGSVVALEEDKKLAGAAATALSGYPNVVVATGALAAGWSKSAPFDAILFEGATELVPHDLCRQLKDGGRLVCVLGSGPAAKATIYTRSGDDFGSRPLFDAAASLLPGFAKKPVFAF